MDTTKQMAAAITAEIRERAVDLAVNDCQMWDNLPGMVRAVYWAEAVQEIADETDQL